MTSSLRETIAHVW